MAAFAEWWVKEMVGMDRAQRFPIQRFTSLEAMKGQGQVKERQPELIAGQTWYPRPRADTREILDRDTVLGGEVLVHYRSQDGFEGWTTPSNFHHWRAAFAATPDPQG
jgi:hypothetical protein